MYSFGNRGDCTIIDEPLYAYYLDKTGIDHPGREEVLISMSTDHVKVINEVLMGSYSTPLLFIKNMAHHIYEIDPEFLLKLDNIFLIRNTNSVVNSIAKIIDNPGMLDIGIKKEWELFEYLSGSGSTPVVIDSDLLLEDPGSVLKKVCEKLDIEFKSQMLKWEAGPREADGVWARYWYLSTHKSTGFGTVKKTPLNIPEKLNALCEEADLYYRKMLKFAIQP